MKMELQMYPVARLRELNLCGSRAEIEKLRDLIKAALLLGSANILFVGAAADGDAVVHVAIHVNTPPTVEPEVSGPMTGAVG